MTHKISPVRITISSAMIFLIVLSLGLSQSRVGAKTNAISTVCLEGPPDCHYNFIQAAVDAAASGSEIRVAAGVYQSINSRPRHAGAGMGSVSQVVYIDKDITIRGGYARTNFVTAYPLTQTTILDAQGLGRVLYITNTSSVVIENLVLENGVATGLDDDAGGGLYAARSNVLLRGNVIRQNKSNAGAGAYFRLGTV